MGLGELRMTRGLLLRVLAGLVLAALVVVVLEGAARLLRVPPVAVVVRQELRDADPNGMSRRLVMLECLVRGRTLVMPPTRSTPGDCEAPIDRC